MIEPSREQLIDRIVELERLEREATQHALGAEADRDRERTNTANAKAEIARLREQRSTANADTFVMYVKEYDRRQVLQERLDEVRVFVEGMKTWASPHGVALDYANRILAVLEAAPGTDISFDAALEECSDAV